jgi:endonuclease YncB( thermonuclease family)
VLSTWFVVARRVLALAARVLAAGCVLTVTGCGPVGRATGPPRWVPGPGPPRPAPYAPIRPACGGPCGTTVVTRVVDGDTLVLRGLGRVRLIGMDAPETWLRHDCFGPEATGALRRLTPPGSPVRTAGDVDPRDRYGRRLLYLWTPRGVFVNAELVRTGFARAMAIPPDTSHAAAIGTAENTARQTRTGIWQAALAGCGVVRRLSGGRETLAGFGGSGLWAVKPG